MNSQTGQLYPSMRAGIDDGVDPALMIELKGDLEAVLKVHRAVVAAEQRTREPWRKRGRPI